MVSDQRSQTCNFGVRVCGTDSQRLQGVARTALRCSFRPCKGCQLSAMPSVLLQSRLLRDRSLSSSSSPGLAWFCFLSLLICNCLLCSTGQRARRDACDLGKEVVWQLFDHRFLRTGALAAAVPPDRSCGRALASLGLRQQCRTQAGCGNQLKQLGGRQHDRQQLVPCTGCAVVS